MMYRNRKLLDLMGSESKLAVRIGLVMPCQNCGRWLPTCGAHSNLLRHGKGRGLKAHDCFAAALCHGCHTLVDGGGMSRNEASEAWFDAHCGTFVTLLDAGAIETPLMLSGNRAIPGTVSSATWLSLWQSGDARVTV